MDKWRIRGYLIVIMAETELNQILTNQVNLVLDCNFLESSTYYILKERAVVFLFLSQNDTQLHPREECKNTRGNITGLDFRRLLYN